MDLNLIPAGWIRTTDIAKELKTKRSLVIKLAREHGVNFNYVNIHGRFGVFSPENAARIRALWKNPRADIWGGSHPLVTDKRCLRLSYWPDVVPDIFKCE